MILILILKNLFLLIKNCISIFNLIKKKEIYYLILLISINLFILPSIAYCETADVEKPELSLEEQQKRSKLINNICLIIFGIAFLILLWDFLGYLFDEDDDIDFYGGDSCIDEVPEVKPPHKPYTQGVGYHFFVRDMGIRYDDNLYSIPEVDVTTTNLYDPKDGPIANPQPGYTKVDVERIGALFPNLDVRAPLETIPETSTSMETPKPEFEYIVTYYDVED